MRNLTSYFSFLVDFFPFQLFSSEIHQFGIKRNIMNLDGTLAKEYIVAHVGYVVVIPSLNVDGK